MLSPAAGSPSREPPGVEPETASSNDCAARAPRRNASPMSSPMTRRSGLGSPSGNGKRGRKSARKSAMTSASPCIDAASLPPAKPPCEATPGSPARARKRNSKPATEMRSVASHSATESDTTPATGRPSSPASNSTTSRPFGTSMPTRLPARAAARAELARTAIRNAARTISTSSFTFLSADSRNPQTRQRQRLAAYGGRDALPFREAAPFLSLPPPGGVTGSLLASRRGKAARATAAPQEPLPFGNASCPSPSRPGSLSAFGQLAPSEVRQAARSSARPQHQAASPILTPLWMATIPPKMS